MVQMKDFKGKLIWVTIYNRVIIHPETGDYYSYIYLKEDDEFARQENASVEPLLIDAMTDFYDEALLSKAVNKALKNNKEKKEYGMIILDMVNYSSQKSQMGDTIFAQVFSRIAEDFRLIFPSRHICAVKDKGEFVFFLEEDKNTSIREVSEKLLEKLKTLFLMVDPKGTFIFYGGIACHSQGQNYNELYENAYIARNMATRGENWSYALYWNQEKEIQSTGLVLEEAVSFAKNQMGLINDDKFTSIEDREMVQTSLLCLKNFVERQDIEAALFNACKILADYYFADGVFITEIKEASREESLTLKWERGKNSFSKERDHQENHEYMEIFLQAYRQKEGFTSNNIVAVPFLIDGF
jgi:GGDEF domain-containing protein